MTSIRQTLLLDAKSDVNSESNRYDVCVTQSTFTSNKRLLKALQKHRLQDRYLKRTDEWISPSTKGIVFPSAKATCSAACLIPQASPQKLLFH